MMESSFHFFPLCYSILSPFLRRTIDEILYYVLQETIMDKMDKNSESCFNNASIIRIPMNFGVMLIV